MDKLWGRQGYGRINAICLCQMLSVGSHLVGSLDRFS
jgi:hypothetical protein